MENGASRQMQVGFAGSTTREMVGFDAVFPKKAKINGIELCQEQLCSRR
jgi:hypothetical protein